jgi:hypothetical protein
VPGTDVAISSELVPGQLHVIVLMLEVGINVALKIDVPFACD